MTTKSKWPRLRHGEELQKQTERKRDKERKGEIEIERERERGNSRQELRQNYHSFHFINTPNFRCRRRPHPGPHSWGTVGHADGARRLHCDVQHKTTKTTTHRATPEAVAAAQKKGSPLCAGPADIVAVAGQRGV